MAVVDYTHTTKESPAKERTRMMQMVPPAAVTGGGDLSSKPEIAPDELQAATAGNISANNLGSNTMCKRPRLTNGYGTLLSKKPNLNLSDIYGIKSPEITLTLVNKSETTTNNTFGDHKKQSKISETNSPPDNNNLSFITKNSDDETVPLIDLEPLTGENNKVVYNIVKYCSKADKQKRRRRLTMDMLDKETLNTDGKTNIPTNGIFTNEISITKVPANKTKSCQLNNKEIDQERMADVKEDPEGMLVEACLNSSKKESSEEKDSEAKDNTTVPVDRVYNFWEKSGKLSSTLYQAKSLLQNDPKPNISLPKGPQFTYPEPTVRPQFEENWDTEPSQVHYLDRTYQILDDEWGESWDVTNNSHAIISDQSNYSPDSAYGSMGDSEMSNYLVGFLNPPGENRCWLNATLHALFPPLFSPNLLGKDMQSFACCKCSKTTKLLVEVYETWKKGASEKHKLYSTLKKFKESLSVIDETYCSKRQQDVSEFLMLFLNHIKTEFDKILTKYIMLNIEHSETSETTTKNQHDSDREQNNEFSETSSFSNTLVENDFINKSGCSDSQESIETNKKIINPIDKYFEQNLVEVYICKGCGNRRKVDVSNLVLYIVLPTEAEDTVINLADAVEKNFEVEERNYNCEKCQHHYHSMTTYFKEYPKILTIQIKRYATTSDTFTSVKICNPISIPEKLHLSHSLTDDMEESKTYEPLSIISHVGGNIDCGHYTSYVRHEDNWFHYNDVNVMPMTNGDALAAAQMAYILFYVDSDLLEKSHSDCYSSS